MAAQQSMNAMNQLSIFPQHAASTLAARAVVVALVAAVHLAVWSVWSQQPDSSAAAPHELSVSFAMVAQAPRPAIAQTRTITPMPVAVPLETEPAMAAVEQPVPAEPAAAPASATVVDSAPDYKASYLNNAPPSYPLLARRMGLQGKVVLNVEVLAAGGCGEVRVHQSSGHALLDNAALQAVKTWRFTPARQAGHSVDKWFMIPINFSLKDQSA